MPRLFPTPLYIHADELLLVERREASSTTDSVPEDTTEVPTMAQITAVTANLPKRNFIHDIDGTHHSDDVRIFFM